MTYTVIIPAAGQGKRMKAGKNKQFLQLNDRPVIIHTLQVFERDPMCKQVIVVANHQEIKQMEALFQQYALKKVDKVIEGGAERQESVFEGIKAVDDREGMVIIHDGARPFIEVEQIHELLTYVTAEQGAVLGTPVTDTIKRIDEHMNIVETVPRKPLVAVQTPQAFTYPMIHEAYQNAFTNQFVGTDDTSLVEYMGKEVTVVFGNEDNIKLTTPFDLAVANVILRQRQGRGDSE
ncbi:2-C-methyl-D-erythritol 4-phosphate cytidylyltransferase [Geomicrobium sp. JCM 19038]|uniref:2-C-methyl-D-erythritol 4-phosphate cytidylyltransferase n=1 Tax=Geomicrobium sp. JCM 19038 TaxID=1460635 RepID=UPI00045F4BF0|nr:2-C-methyl-D-erythritol 4-phosphate cytidylyltransferase [Geomicrobium sp. JCM 19038]GAK09528.1 2-C-methyl-D-erythritol 4-phosphate cytidylyltransferase [Geomicrobium sp. JCM 19038]